MDLQEADQSGKGGLPPQDQACHLAANFHNTDLGGLPLDDQDHQLAVSFGTKMSGLSPSGEFVTKI